APAETAPATWARSRWASTARSDPDVRTALRVVQRVRAAAVGAGDRGHDREPEARAAATPAAGGAAEALERAVEEPGRKAAPLVAHVQLDGGLPHAGFEHDRAVAVAECVLDEVAERLLEAQPVALELETRRCVDGERPPRLLRPPREPVPDARQELVRRDLLAAEV